MLAGPNGSGKTTLYETRVAPALKVPFINADIIQREELKDGNVKAAYAAARIAAVRRQDFLKARQSFATESVFSHPSKLDFITDAKTLGYRIMLFHVGLKTPDLSIARVAERVREGGHDVPTDKIRQRYERYGPLIREAAMLSDITHVYDNSKLNQPPERVMSITRGQVSFVATHLPGWVLGIYGEVLDA